MNDDDRKEVRGNIIRMMWEHEQETLGYALYAALETFDNYLKKDDEDEADLMLRARFQSLFLDCDSHTIEKVCISVLRKWDEPHRKYHTRRHLTECLYDLDRLKSEGLLSGKDANVMEIALWFHDVVYYPQRTDNELASAMYCAIECDHLNLHPRDAADTARRLINLTDHRSGILASDFSEPEKLFLDIDLSILSAHPKAFVEYERQIREEYSFVEESVFRAKRVEILERLGGERFSYHSAAFAHRNEAARLNLKRSIAQLKSTRSHVDDS